MGIGEHHLHVAGNRLDHGYLLQNLKTSDVVASAVHSLGKLRFISELLHLDFELREVRS